jgi:copper(I)-binding protein
MNVLKTALAAAVAAVVLPAFTLPALAHDGVMINDAYARFMPGAMAGAAFMLIENHTTEDDRLVGAAATIAEKVELHTHVHGNDGTMQMVAVPEGFVIPAEGVHELKRGGDHVMFMGLKERPAEGSTVHLTLTFEKAGVIEIDVPVDNKR